MGDLNLDADDPKRNLDKKKLETLCVGRTRVLREVTTTRYNQLDHILLNIEKFPVFYSTSFISRLCYSCDDCVMVSCVVNKRG